MRINLTHSEIVERANNNPVHEEKDAALYSCMKAAVKRGYMSRDDLIEIAKWKWRGSRTKNLCEKNTESDVNQITAVSFTTGSERLRIGALLTLDGVRWPMASGILHFPTSIRYLMLW